MNISAKIILRVGETHVLRLPGLGTAGYLWTQEIIENGELVEVSSTTGENLQIDVGDQSTSIGSSRDELFTIQALGVGHSTIRFLQKRPWEPNQTPLNEHILEINISD